MAVTTLAAAALVSPVTVTRAEAGTGVNGPLTVVAADTQYIQRDCVDYPIEFTVNEPNRWDLDLSVQEPSGAETASDYESGQGYVAGTLGAFLCPALDGPGIYNVIATLSVHDPTTYAVVATYQARTSFTLIRGESATTLKTSKTRVVRGKSFVVTGDVTGRTGPYAGLPAESFSDVQVRYRRAGTSRWRLVGEGDLDRNGHYRGRVTVGGGFKPGLVYLRTTFVGDSALLPSQSPQVRMRVLR